jgi:hypothetical protein
MAERTVGIFGWMTVLLLTGCEPEDALAEDDDVDLRQLQANGFAFNGFNFNGFAWNGTSMAGATLAASGSSDWVQLKKIGLPGDAVGVDSWVTGSQLFVKSDLGAVLSGASVANSKFTFDLVEGKAKKKVIKVLSAARLSPGSDVWLYDADIKEGGGEFGPLCVDNDGKRTKAILLSEVWSPTGARSAGVSEPLTFACRGAALAKCVELGYRPWAGASLREYHQACTRMIRADYCGDALSHTVDGTPIHILDAIGVQNQDPNVDYVVEAEWGPGGAVCLNPGNTRLPNQDIECQLPVCGPSSFASGGLIQSGKVLSGP